MSDDFSEDATPESERVQLGKWLETAELPKTGSTPKWAVYNSSTGLRLGTVKWYGPWRQFCFSVGEAIILNSTCLRDIAQFCENRMKDHRLKGVRPQSRRQPTALPPQ